MDRDFMWCVIAGFAFFAAVIIFGPRDKPKPADHPASSKCACSKEGGGCCGGPK